MRASDGAASGRFVRRWRDFWFLPESTAALGVVRIAFGVLVFGWTLSLLPHLGTFFGDGSVTPSSPTAGFEWGLFDLGGGPGLRLAVWAGLLLATVMLAVGWHSRLAACLVLVGVMSFQRGSPFVFNAGDALIRLEAFYLVLAPSGAALSMDRRRIDGSFWSAQIRAPWALRLMQVQLSVIYVFSFLNKVPGETWREGTAVSYALRMTDIANFSVPEPIVADALVMNVATWVALGLELAIGVLVWNRRARPKVLAAGAILHAVFLVTFGIAFFSFAVFVLYLAFLPPDGLSAWAARRRDRRRRDRRELDPAPGADQPPRARVVDALVGPSPTLLATGRRPARGSRRAR
ncbi:MAG: HTTM domain-containing protein [Acidimicrobiales bacterium]|nr:HTTM domain-containing protein [Acidimicrobiales bacterium]